MKMKKKLISIPFSLLAIVLILFIRVYIFQFLLKNLTDLPQDKLMIETSDFFAQSRIIIVLSCYSFFIKFTIEWIKYQKQKADLINQNQASELALLRSQVNPHFLFNTLNNIYSLVLKKSEDAPTAMMKLSSIMRYMLYESNAEKVLLEKEIEYINSFIELQKLRISDSGFVELTINGNISNRLIAPMLLIPFIENAFKHGSKNVKSPGIIINFKMEQNKILFEVINYFSTSDSFDKDKIGGIGLSNIKRRLELIYHNKHKLDINIDKNKYKINLELSTN